MSPVLVTGFKAFDGYAINSTEVIVSKLHQSNVNTAVLPVEYQACQNWLNSYFSDVENMPVAIIAFGMSVSSAEVRLERLAQCKAGYSKLDTLGNAWDKEESIPASYNATLPLDDIYQSLKAAGVPVTLSDDAGDYLCNYLFYQLCHHPVVQEKKIPVGFIHLPAIQGSLSGNEGLPENVLQQTVELIIQKL